MNWSHVYDQLLPPTIALHYYNDDTEDEKKPAAEAVNLIFIFEGNLLFIFFAGICLWQWRCMKEFWCWISCIDLILVKSLFLSRHISPEVRTSKKQWKCYIAIYHIFRNLIALYKLILATEKYLILKLDAVSTGGKCNELCG